MKNWLFKAVGVYFLFRGISILLDLTTPTIDSSTLSVVYMGLGIMILINDKLL